MRLMLRLGALVLRSPIAFFAGTRTRITFVVIVFLRGPPLSPTVRFALTGVLLPVLFLRPRFRFAIAIVMLFGRFLMLGPAVGFAIGVAVTLFRILLP